MRIATRPARSANGRRNAEESRMVESLFGRRAGREEPRIARG